MSKDSCIVCGQTVDKERAWVKCPKEQTNVCMKHCFSGCTYLDEDISLPRCNFRREK